MYKDTQLAIEAATQTLRNRKVAKLCAEFNQEAKLVTAEEVRMLFEGERRLQRLVWDESIRDAVKAMRLEAL